jgi:hypothetical protein
MAPWSSMYSTPGQGGDHPVSMSGFLDGENAFGNAF